MSDHDAFFAKYTFVENKFGSAPWPTDYGSKLFELTRTEKEYVFEYALLHPNKVWTLIDTGEDVLVISNGFHYVNREGFFITNEDGEEMEEYSESIEVDE